MPDTPTLLRQWMLLTTLCARRHGATVREMAQEHSVNEKTIRRDLLTLKRVGLPVEEAKSDHGRKHWMIREPHDKPALSFSLSEVLSLHLGRQFMEPLAGTHFWKEANRAFHKIRATLKDSALEYLDKLAGTFHQTAPGATNYSERADIIDALMIAVEDCKVTLLVYQSDRSTEPVTREIHPYGWVFHRSSLYLVAYATAHKDIRTYKADRISEVDVTDLKFPRPKGFDLAEYLEGAFGVYRGGGKGKISVRVTFQPAVARFVTEKQWHPSQELTPQPDGTLLAEFKLSATEEIKSWLLGFGANAHVLGPESLRKEIVAELEKSLDRYRVDRSKRKPR